MASFAKTPPALLMIASVSNRFETKVHSRLVLLSGMHFAELRAVDIDTIELNRRSLDQVCALSQTLAGQRQPGGLGKLPVKRRTSHVAEKGRTSHYGHRF
jgi:hypothetical protein